jgi:hypothetical protein
LKGQLCVAGLVLDVLSDKNDDRISGAISRALREERQKSQACKKEKDNETKDQKKDAQVPLPNPQNYVYQTGPWIPWWGQQNMPWQPPQTTSGANHLQNFGQPRFGQFSRKRKITCYACGQDHLMKDCLLLKQATLKKDKQE